MDKAISAQNKKARSFAALHRGVSAFVIANPWDVGSAQILKQLGFQALATTSAGFAMSLGRKDGTFSRKETFAHARQIVKATSLPVSADLENGFGNRPEDVAETIRRAAQAGLVGGSIDDASGSKEAPIYDIGLAVERITAAVETARSLPFDFTLVARAENYLQGRLNLSDTLERLQRFEAAGADVLYAPGLKDIVEIRSVCANLSRPVNVVVGLGDSQSSVSDYTKAGVRRISLGSTLSRVAYGALFEAARQIVEDGNFTKALKLAMPKDNFK